ncbi:testis-expressed protein 9-like [Sitodiplosis mosellana]|uniref:testis-expressed protein 9-like n=1 Tax=Sitodiplosis mosellana TaxID=263140 RepID=UPI0024439D43|nr:testis-expressed protein 9-like [Sitodiplosis mosellana]
MCDPFLEREKELMKLNELLNSKMSFDPKTPKTNNAKSNNKIKKSTTSKPLRNDANQPKNGMKEANKLRIDSSCDVKKPFANTHSTDKLCEKYELDPKDNAFNRNNNNHAKNDDANKICNETKRTTDDNGGNDNNNDAPSNGDTNMCDTLIDTIEKSIDTKPSTNATQLSLIPGNVFRKNTSADGIIKFLKAKVTILQQELNLSHTENIKNLDNLAKAIELQKKTEAARCQAVQSINALNAQIQKLQQNEMNITLKLKENESVQQSHRKECDELRLKLKTAHQSNASLELRLQKSLDDLECLRKNYRVIKNTEKDLQLSLQHERTFYENQLKMNQKQRNDLIAALKKHMLLIGNLKQQNTCLTQAKCIQMSESEFLKILDWNHSNGTKNH